MSCILAPNNQGNVYAGAYVLLTRTQVLLTRILVLRWLTLTRGTKGLPKHERKGLERDSFVDLRRSFS